MEFQKTNDLKDKGLSMIIYGSAGCLSGDTFINYEIRKDKKSQNKKGGTLEHLYRRFNGMKTKGKGYYQREQTKNSEYYVQSIDEEGKIFLNKALNVVYSGRNIVYEITTEKGYKIKATLDHKFFTGTSYLALKDLTIGNSVFVHTNYIPKKGRDKRPYRKEVFVKYHPYWNKKLVDKYEYCRAFVHEAVVEAYMNKMGYDEFINFLNTKSKEEIERKLKFKPIGYQIHHLDENINNNNISNLILVTPKEHFEYHKEFAKRICYYVQEDKIVNKQIIGEMDTYDIQVEAPYHNFVANKIVVHNCGKTTLAKTLPAEEILLLTVDAGEIVLQDSNINYFKMEEGQANKFNEFVKYLQTEKYPFKYVFIDNMSELEKYFVMELAKSRRGENAIPEIREWGDVSFRMRKHIRELRNLTYKGVNVIFIFWDMPLKITDKDGTIESIIAPMCMKGSTMEFMGLVDFVAYMGITEKGARYLQFEGNETVKAKKRDLSGGRVLEKFEKPDLGAIFSKLRGEK